MRMLILVMSSWSVVASAQTDLQLGGFPEFASWIRQQYDRNAIAADTHWKGGRFNVVGTIVDIRQPPVGKPYIALSGNELFTIRCIMNDQTALKFEDLQVGQTVVVTGTGEGKALASVQLRDCDLVSVFSKETAQSVAATSAFCARELMTGYCKAAHVEFHGDLDVLSDFEKQAETFAKKNNVPLLSCSDPRVRVLFYCDLHDKPTLKECTEPAVAAASQAMNRMGLMLPKKGAARSAKN